MNENQPTPLNTTPQPQKQIDPSFPWGYNAFLLHNNPSILASGYFAAASWLPFIGFLCGTAGIYFGKKGLKTNKMNPKYGVAFNGIFAIAASSIGIIVSIVLTYLMAS